MSTYAITGSASGMGLATATLLRERGHTVVGIDLRDADVIADLSTPEGREFAAAEAVRLAGGKLDGAVLAAGLGPVHGRERLIAEVNFFGVVDLLTAWQSTFAKNDSTHVVIVSSNSTTTVPAVPKATVKAFLKANRPRIYSSVKIFGKNGAAMVYAGSKIAVTRWMRRTAVTAEWAGKGIRMNAIAPGAILTPLLQQQLDDPELAGAIENFPVPVGGFGDPKDIAKVIEFMLSPAAKFMVGTTVFVDGGTDALYRSDDWPVAVPLRKISRYLKVTKAFNAANTAAK